MHMPIHLASGEKLSSRLKTKRNLKSYRENQKKTKKKNHQITKKIYHLTIKAPPLMTKALSSPIQNPAMMIWTT